MNNLNVPNKINQLFNKSNLARNKYLYYTVLLLIVTVMLLPVIINIKDNQKSSAAVVAVSDCVVPDQDQRLFIEGLGGTNITVKDPATVLPTDNDVVCVPDTNLKSELLQLLKDSVYRNNRNVSMTGGNESYAKPGAETEVYTREMALFSSFGHYGGSSFGLGGKSIESIVSLEYATNVNHLFMDNNSVSSLMPISNMTSLTSLSLRNNQLTGVADIQNLTGLDHLYLSNNQISDVAPLQAMTNLTDLYFDQNQVSDLTPLQGMTSLVNLGFWQNQVTTIPDFQNLTNLYDINGYNNSINDISGLANLSNLAVIHFANNQISDLAPLQNMSSLHHLTLNGNLINNDGMAIINGLTNLESISIGYNQISDITGMDALTNLTNINFDYNQIANLTPLQSLTGLEGVSFNNNRVFDISPLSGLNNVNSLGLANNSPIIYINQPSFANPLVDIDGNAINPTLVNGVIVDPNNSSNLLLNDPSIEGVSNQSYELNFSSSVQIGAMAGPTDFSSKLYVFANIPNEDPTFTAPATQNLTLPQTNLENQILSWATNRQDNMTPTDDLNLSYSTAPVAPTTAPFSASNPQPGTYQITYTLTDLVGNSSTQTTNLTLSGGNSQPPTNLAYDINPSLGQNSVHLTWQAPADNGSSPINDYIIEFKPSSDSSWQQFNDGTSTNLEATVTGLDPNIVYDFRVIAVNGSGNSGPSNTISTRPSYVTLSVSGGTTVSLFPNPSDQGSIYQTVTGDTNYQNGASLYLSIVDNNPDNQRMINSSDSSSFVNPLSSASPAALTANSWGFRLPDQSATFGQNTDYTTKLFLPVPLNNNAYLLQNNTTSPVDLEYSLLVNNSLSSGVYNQTVLYTIITNP